MTLFLKTRLVVTMLLYVCKYINKKEEEEKSHLSTELVQYYPGAFFRLWGWISQMHLNGVLLI